jgi:hypothetical protein
LTAEATGNPLTFAATTAGINLQGWGGTQGPTLSFGEHPEGAPTQARHVTILNASPMDAHLSFHIAGDRHPAATVPPCSVDLIPNLPPPPVAPLQHPLDTGEEVDALLGPSGSPSMASLAGSPAAAGVAVAAAAAAPWKPVSVSIRAQSDRNPTGVDLPFSIYPLTLTVPAYGKASVKVGTGDVGVE